MRKLATLPVGILVVLPVLLAVGIWWGGAAYAEPAWGGNCLACHGEAEAGTLVLFGADGTADPNEAATGAPDRGTLPVYRVYRGQSKRLQFDLADLGADDTYAVELKRLQFRGVERNAALTYEGDCEWPEWGEGARYYTQPAVKDKWGTGPTAFAYDLRVQTDAGADYYDLVFAVAGKRKADGALYYAEEHFYVQVRLLPGDANCDGVVDFADINPFILAFTNPAGYAAAFPNCPITSCDLNGDGRLTSADINPFIDVLMQG